MNDSNKPSQDKPKPKPLREIVGDNEPPERLLDSRPKPKQKPLTS